MSTIAPATIKHLLVPLDGSRLAEAALPAATMLAERLGARVTLLHVMERHAPATVHGERHLTRAGEAEAYLNGVASRFADAGVPVEATSTRTRRAMSPPAWQSTRPNSAPTWSS